MVKAVPDGYHTITPYLTVHRANRLIEFLERAFAAEVRHRMADEQGNVRHAELQIGDSRVMIGGAPPDAPTTASHLYMYVAGVDELYQRALAAGGVSLSPPTDQFYGDRHAGVTDPCGNTWWISTHVEDVAPDEMKRREAEFLAKKKSG